MNAAPSLYERMRALVDPKASNLSLARARIQTQDTVSPSSSSAVPVENPQVTSSTLCPHVADPELAEWYAEHPEVICARCWLERRGKPIQARRRSPTLPPGPSRNRGARR